MDRTPCGSIAACRATLHSATHSSEFKRRLILIGQPLIESVIAGYYSAINRNYFCVKRESTSASVLSSPSYFLLERDVRFLSARVLSDIKSFVWIF